jgi:plastocyanin
MFDKRAVRAASVAALLVFAGVPGVGFGLPGRDVSGAQDQPAVKARVLVKDNYFEPRSTEVLEGGQVLWKWRGENRHNIRFTKVPEGAARKGASLRSEGKWKRKFHRPGVYRYVCKVWSGMRGTVTVRPEEPLPE